ncbi:MAG TPA: PfkB family carbohydrate kinase [Chloroflexota bacterium]|nr:PfkB family carbohydrate kinase [Chloroflexota bacterium]
MTAFPALAPDRLNALIDAFARQRVVVVGDMVADEYIYGRPTRISREAPVLVLEFTRRHLVPGGATNVAVNLRALGARVQVVGMVGDDATGRELTAMLEAAGIETAGLIVDPDRPTCTKTRIAAGGSQVVQQQIVRVDRVTSGPLAPVPKQALLRAAARALDGATGVILSDYENGVIDPEVIKRCLPATTQDGLVTTVDAHGDLFRFQGVTLATPNQPEAEAMLGHPLPDLEALRAGGQWLLNGMNAQGLLITRGDQGMFAMDQHGLFAELPAFNQAEVSDVTGAGDTVAATATLALCAGATLLEAAMIGNVAAGLVVRRLGAATTNGEELLHAFRALNLPHDG